MHVKLTAVVKAARSEIANGGRARPAGAGYGDVPQTRNAGESWLDVKVTGCCTAACIEAIVTAVAGGDAVVSTVEVNDSGADRRYCPHC